MNKLFVFGDSFSEKWDDSSPYSGWKGYTPKVYSEIISERLGIEQFNYAQSGWSNYDIFQSVCKNIDKISDGDIVIIGWSGLSRFRLANPKFGNWLQFQPNSWKLNKEANLLWEGISESTIDEILYNRSNFELYKEEIRDYVKLLSKTFEKNIFVNFTWSVWDWELKEIPYQTIRTESNGEIDDWHWSEKGHLDFSDWVLDKIQKNRFINELI